MADAFPKSAFADFPHEDHVADYTTSIIGINNPKWLSGRAQNYHRSSIFKLSDDLIYKVADHLDEISARVFRQTCGRFKAILPPVPFRPEDDLTFEEYNSYLNQAASPLTRDALCKDCTEFQNNGSLYDQMESFHATLFCSKCLRSHSRSQFSSDEADKPRHDRQCILWDGHFRFCNHKFISVNDMVAVSRSGLDHHDTFECQDPSHVTPIISGNERRNPSVTMYTIRTMGMTHVRIKSEMMALIMKLNPGVPVTREALQKGLQSQEVSLSGVICHHTSVRDNRILLPFGPDTCACFDPYAFSSHSHEDIAEKDNCCRCRAQHDAGRKQVFMPSNTTTHEVECEVCQASYCWIREGDQLCLRIKRAVTLYCIARGGDHSHFDLNSLLPYIHPESWGAHQDEALKHLAYCDDAECSRRWLWKRLTRLECLVEDRFPDPIDPEALYRKSSVYRSLLNSSKPSLGWPECRSLYGAPDALSPFEARLGL